MTDSTTTYVRLLLKVLQEIVPDLDFYTCVLPAEANDDCTVYLFGLRPNGQLAGGYAVPLRGMGNDIYEDGVVVTRFFLTAQAAAEALFHPPAIRRVWEDTRIHGQLLREVWESR